ncbi:MAG TPA: histidine phosphatase family protein [Candidatus Nitrosocosmicus sp.]|nr:histidine phosphatase family protein [Candidatus Nitrosocosmicus sp.]
MRRLLLARHGQSVSNAVRRFQGVQDVPLSELGRRQAEALAGAFGQRRIAAVYSSPLQRARHTAELVAAAVQAPLRSVDDLRELSLGEWEGCTVEEVEARPGNPYACWVRDPVGSLPPGGEPLADVQGRMVRALADIERAHPNGDDVLVVCHGGVISAYLAHCLGLPLSSIWRLTVSNCSITELAPPRLLSMNVTTHLTGIAVPPSGFPTLSP